MRKTSNKGNIGRLLIQVEGRISVESLKSKLQEEEFYKWIGSITFQKGFLFSPPTWKVEEFKKIQIHYHEPTTQSIPEEIFDRDIQLSNPPLIHLDLLHHPNKISTLILSWHHSIMDARGAETFLRTIGEQFSHAEYLKLFPAIPSEKGLIELLNTAREAKKFIISRTPKKLASVVKKGQTKKTAQYYKIIELNEQETQIIESKATELGLRFGLSPLYLAAICRGLYQLLNRSNKFSGEIWVPVPQDQRLRGHYGSIISNQVSYLFYKLSEPELLSLKTTVDSITNQMKALIRDGVTKKYWDLMNLFKRIPLALYTYMIKGPTKGALASFFFSDIGDSLKDFSTFFNLPITDAVHFPPNVCPPGFTVIFMKFNSKLKIVIGFSDINFSDEEVKELETFIKVDLIK